MEWSSKGNLLGDELVKTFSTGGPTAGWVLAAIFLLGIVVLWKVNSGCQKQLVDQRAEFEKTLVENGTTVLKFMLHISRDEQRERLQDRLDKPESRWKFNPGDLEDRKLWDDYQQAYEVMLEKCSTDWAPWYVVPADDKKARNYFIAKTVVETLEGLGLRYPKADREVLRLKRKLK